MGDETPSSRMTYGNYLRLDELLNLQSVPEGHNPAPCNDEMHFIVTHQAFGYGLKQIIRELKQGSRFNESKRNR